MRLSAGLVGALAALLATGCSTSPSVKGILLITVDTTRADRIGAYGYERASTPTLDGLALEGSRFADAVSPVPVTLPSHASMFTGQYPPHHGVRYNGMFILPEAARTAAELLSEGGWRTGAVPAAFPVSRGTGIAQGFVDFLDIFEEAKAEGRELPVNAERKASEVTERATGWLQKDPSRRFFLWAHYFDPHWPYEPPFPYSSQFRDRPYDGEIAYMDAQIGRLFDAMKREGIWENTLVIVVGDHGEGLYDHGEKMHSSLVYQSTLHVPLIVKPPGKTRARVVDAPVSLADIGPTLLDYAGIAAFPDADGRSLRPLLEGTAIDSRPIYFETLAGSLVYGWSPLEGIRRNEWKYVRSTSPELFDLSADPAELDNRAPTDRERANDFDQQLTAMERHWEGGASSSAPLDAEALERLASLGYVGGNLVEARRGGPSPRDRIHLETAILAANRLMANRRHQEAFEAWRLILRDDPSNRYALENAAYAAARAGRPKEGFVHAAELTGRYPEYELGWVLYGDLHVSAGDVDSALRIYREGLVRHPASEPLSYRTSVALLVAGRFGEALELAERASSRKGSSPSFLIVEAAAEASQGRMDEAAGVLERAISAGYRDLDTLRSEPALSALRRVPRFETIVATIPDKPKSP
jgi:arylsulfatase A-like enzyme